MAPEAEARGVARGRCAALLSALSAALLSALSAALLFRPRLPNQGGAAAALGGLVALWILCRVGERRFFAALVGQVAGVLVAHRWAFAVLRAPIGLSAPRAALALLLTVLALCLPRALLVRSASRGAPPLVLSALWALGEASACAWQPFVEAHTLAFALADLPLHIGERCLRAGGPALLSLCLSWLALARGPRGRGAALLLLCGAALLGAPPHQTGSALTLAGLQLAPRPTTARLDGGRQEVLRAYQRAEQAAPANLVIWPEASYPYREHIGADGALAALEPPTGYQRIVGLHAGLGGFRVGNAVVVQGAGGGVRFKQRLAPLYETALLHAPRREIGTVSVAGQPALLPICYEVFDRRLLGAGPFALGVSLSADAFDGSGQASRLSTRATWLRALECRVPFVRVSDASFSAAYAADGTELARLGPGSGTLRAQLHLPAAPLRCGERQARTLIMLGLLVGLGSGLALRRRSK